MALLHARSHARSPSVVDAWASQTSRSRRERVKTGDSVDNACRRLVAPTLGAPGWTRYSFPEKIAISCYSIHGPAAPREPV